MVDLLVLLMAVLLFYVGFQLIMVLCGKNTALWSLPAEFGTGSTHFSVC